MDIPQEMVRGWGPTTGDGQGLCIYHRRWLKTTDLIQEMVRDCKHDIGDRQTMGMIQEMVREFKDGQRL